MTYAPKRVWLDWPAANKGDPVFDEPPERETQPGQTEYIRADIHAAAVARAEKAEAELARIKAEGAKAVAEIEALLVDMSLPGYVADALERILSLQAAALTPRR